MNSTSIGVQIVDRVFVTEEERKKERFILEETMEDVERICNFGDSNMISEYFLLNDRFYDAVYNISPDPVLLYVTDERK